MAKRTVSSASASKPRRRKAAAPQPPRNNKIWVRIGKGFLLTVSVSAVFALCLTAYAGCVSPLKHGGTWGILPLAFPICLAAVVLLLIACLLLWRRCAFVPLAGLIACAGPVLTYFPINIGTPKAPEGSEIFTIMTYNSKNLRSDSSAVRNEQIDHVIASGADFVCIQEGGHFGINNHSRITPEQLDTLHSIYPHIHLGGKEPVVVLSKYPIRPLHFEVNKSTFPGGDLAAYRVNLPSGKMITIFSVHLSSMRFSSEDRELYYNVTEFRGQDLDSVRSRLLGKLSYSAVERAKEVQQLMRWLRQYAGPDVIVCGDFNDVPDCYAIRTLADAGFRSVYPEVGFGPMITYNADRFYFCIDHVLYRGAFKPLKLTKGKSKASDHYPLTVEFAVY